VLVLGSTQGWFGGGGQPSGTPVAGSPSSSTPRPNPPGISTVVDGATDSSYGADVTRFATPSGNIACAMSAAEVRCDVAQRSWTIPPAPPGCAGEFGAGTVLAGTGRGELSCVSDTLADPGLKVLDYGTAVRRDGVVCASRETGVRCENESTGHGFQVARAAYELF
jgi:hypothetical protein